MRKVSSPTARGLAISLATFLTSAMMTAAPASAVTPPAPGDFTGFGFDACVAPSQKVMDAWNLTSPYSAIGIYISGNSRYCGDAYQPNLSKDWVQKNADNGWRFMPIHVGYQAPCFKNNPSSRVQKKRMSTTTATARSQATSDGKEVVAAAKKYGFGAKSAVYLDMEYYNRSDTRCDAAVRQFIDAWNEEVAASGYLPGLYSSGSAAIKSIDLLRANPPAGYTFPKHMWIAWTNKVADTDGGPYLSDSGWTNHQRIHQYWNGVDVRYGGYTLNIDKDYLDVGKGSVATSDARKCDVTLTYKAYPSLYPGVSRAEVKAAQCLLGALGFPTPPTGTMDASTTAAVNQFKKARGFPQDGKITRREWVILLSNGSKPRVLKFGSVGEPVWRLQRALLADQAMVKVTGVYDKATETAVAALRKFNGASSAVTTESTVWALLNKGARHH
ncbi:MAG: glycoside hydrolase domain-containing protein [Aeromicrobium sp.]